MSVTIVSTPYDVKSNTISVKPYFDPNISNLGLEKYNMSLHDGVFHEEQLAVIERNGIKRYITGLNEFAPEIKLIQDKEQREAKIKDIREKVSQLEKELAANIIDPTDPDFWNNVKLLKHDNDEFWSQITMRCGNQKIPLDPAKDPYDLIKLCAIEAGGFSIIAPSYEAAKSMPSAPKFFLDKYADTASSQTEIKKLRNKALAELETLFNSNQNKLFYVAKVVDPNSPQYKKSTPNDIIYENMDRWITAQGVESSPKRAAQSFLDACNMDMETLKIKSLIKDATFFKFIALKGDGFIYHVDSGVMMGRNVSDCVEFLKNQLHDATLIDITKKVEQFWNQ